MKFKKPLIVFGVCVVGFVFISLKVAPILDNIRVQRVTEQVMHDVMGAVSDFRKKHGRLPGDINKDGIIGSKNFGNTLLPPENAGENDEARLFWKELNLPLHTTADMPYPETALPYTYLIAGYLDGTPLSQGGAAIKGNVIVWTGRFYGDGSRSYPLRPADAEYAERKLESSVDPHQGWVQAYGTPDCFAANGGYNLDNSDKDCGLIFSIFE